MKSKPAPTKCPSCSSSLTIKQLGCDHCQTGIQGDFYMNRFSQFSKDQLYFIETFLRVEGNIKTMEKELGISYPTVKNRLQKIIGILGYQTPKQEKEALTKLELLEKIAEGEMDVDEAIKHMGGKL